MRNVARDVCIRLLDRAGVPVDGPEPWSIHVHDERLWARVVRSANLGLGESYMDGWWDCAALDQFFARVLGSGVSRATPVVAKIGLATAKGLARNAQSLGRAGDNARRHYDIGNDLFERMLDKRLVYSCGYWAKADDLETAQLDKFDLIARKLGLEPGLRLLDIGCGWGGFAQFAAERHGVEVVGISPAGNQVAAARERCEGLPVEIRQEDYRETRGRFDRIVSIGMMEHVGPKNLGTLFEVCDRLLAPEGMMLHHTIGRLRSGTAIDPWIDRYVFPGAVLPSMRQIAGAVEPRWVVEDVHSFGPDYDRTLMAWHANVSAAWAQLPRYDERFRRMWNYYLLSCAGAFRARQLQLWQWVFRRPGVAPRYFSVR